MGDASDVSVTLMGEGAIASSAPASKDEDVKMEVPSSANGPSSAAAEEDEQPPPPPSYEQFDARTLEQIVTQLRRNQKLTPELDELMRDLPTASSSSTGPVKKGTDHEREKAAASLQYQELRVGDVDGAFDSSAGDAALNDSEMSFLDRAKFVPIRLSYNERPYLRLIEGATGVSSYTDKVDSMLSNGNPRLEQRKTSTMMKQMCSLLSGMLVAKDYGKGQALLKERDFKKYRNLFRAVFEIGRRYKILNPERMREAYGKMMYVMQDSNSTEISELLEFSCVQEVRTVWDVLSKHKNGIALLSDPLLATATMEIRDRGRARRDVERDLSAKQQAKKRLQQNYATVGRAHRNQYGRYNFFRSYDIQGDDDSTIGYHGSEDQLDEETIEQCVASLGDHSTYLRFNREPCDRLLEFLKDNFSATDAGEDAELALSISEGQKGARLSHSHERQYRFVLQSLLLWREVLAHMFQLWHYAEQDLLDPATPYTLTQTGQGLHRVQPCVRVQQAMQRILEKVQRSVGVWIGSNQIHLGDHNVPNALMFIDKYAQVPRICAPIVLCLDKIPKLYTEAQSNKQLIDSFGGPQRLQKLILADFFRHAFDGSGGDNFFDAGSCVDGRLTSAWNWCSQIEKKDYFPVFLLTGFVGFDGEDGWDK